MKQVKREKKTTVVEGLVVVRMAVSPMEEVY